MECHAASSREWNALIHFVDLQPRHTSKVDDFLVYANSFDPIIDDRWSIVQNRGVNIEEETEWPAWVRLDGSGFDGWEVVWADKIT